MAAQSEQEVQAYLDSHKIQSTVEDAINACVKANAEDPCLFMSQHLATKAQPDTIKSVIGRSIFDSRGNPTVEVDVKTVKGFTYRAAVPSGASTGVYEGELAPASPTIVWNSSIHGCVVSPKRLLHLHQCAPPRPRRGPTRPPPLIVPLCMAMSPVACSRLSLIPPPLLSPNPH